MADSPTFEVDIDTIIGNIVSPDELAYLQSIGEWFSPLDFVFDAC